MVKTPAPPAKHSFQQGAGALEALATKHYEETAKMQSDAADSVRVANEAHQTAMREVDATVRKLQSEAEARAREVGRAAKEVKAQFERDVEAAARAGAAAAGGGGGRAAARGGRAQAAAAAAPAAAAGGGGKGGGAGGGGGGGGGGRKRR